MSGLDRLDITFCPGKEVLETGKAVGNAVTLKFCNFLCFQAKITELLDFRPRSKFFHSFDLIIHRLYLGIVMFGIFHPAN